MAKVAHGVAAALSAAPLASSRPWLGVAAADAAPRASSRPRVTKAAHGVAAASSAAHGGVYIPVRVADARLWASIAVRSCMVLEPMSTPESGYSSTAWSLNS